LTPSLEIIEKPVETIALLPHLIPVQEKALPILTIVQFSLIYIWGSREAQWKCVYWRVTCRK